MLCINTQKKTSQTNKTNLKPNHSERKLKTHFRGCVSILLWHTSSPLYKLTRDLRLQRESSNQLPQKIGELCSVDSLKLLFKHICHKKRWETCFSLQQSIFSNLLVQDKKHLQGISSNIKVVPAFNYSAQFENDLQ